MSARGSDGLATQDPAGGNVYSRQSILQWVNGLIGNNQPHYDNLLSVPSKVVARILNNIYGDDICPLNAINFDDVTRYAKRTNCENTLAMLRSPGVGYGDSGFDADQWLANSNLAKELALWRFVRQQALDRGWCRPAPDFTVHVKHQVSQRAAGATDPQAASHSGAAPTATGEIAWRQQAQRTFEVAEASNLTPIQTQIVDCKVCDPQGVSMFQQARRQQFVKMQQLRQDVLAAAKLGNSVRVCELLMSASL